MLKLMLCDAALRRSQRTRDQKATHQKATTVLRSVLLGIFCLILMKNGRFYVFLPVKNGHFQLYWVYFFLPIAAMLKPTLSDAALCRSQRSLQDKKLRRKKLPRCCAIRFWEIFEKLSSAFFKILDVSVPPGGAALFPCEPAQNLPPGAINIKNGWVKTFHQISSSFVK